MSDYKVVTDELASLADGSVRTQPLYFSVDPYLRGMCDIIV